METKIISFVNHKGGVGKTTSVLNVGVCLAKYYKKRVLLIDLDPQANLTTSLGLPINRELNVYTALSGQGKIDLPISQSNESVDVVTSVLDLVNAEKNLSSEVGYEHILSELLEPIKKNYDYILIDCPPSLGALTNNAMVASTDVFIVVQAHFLALQGVGQIIYTIDKIINRINRNLRLSGVILTQFQKNLKLCREVEDVVTEQFDDVVFPTRIRTNITLAESVSQASSVYGWDDTANGATDYKALTKDIVERLEK